MKAIEKRQIKRKQAEERKEKYCKLTIVERIKLVRSRRGNSKRELTNLLKLKKGE